MTRKKTSKADPMPSRSFRAFVLIQTVPGRVDGILRTLRRMPQVRTVDSVTGPYDVVALVEVGELRELSQVVAGQDDRATPLAYVVHAVVEADP